MQALSPAWQGWQQANVPCQTCAPALCRPRAACQLTVALVAVSIPCSTRDAGSTGPRRQLQSAAGGSRCCSGAGSKVPDFDAKHVQGLSSCWATPTDPHARCRFESRKSHWLSHTESTGSDDCAGERLRLACTDAAARMPCRLPQKSCRQQGRRWAIFTGHPPFC